MIGLLIRGIAAEAAKVLRPAWLASSCVASMFFGAIAPVEAGSFEVGQKQFLLDGKPFQIRSGEIHYSRVPAAEWRNRIRMAKAMGLNTICTYVFWNYHEAKPGEFHFSGEKDVAQFIRICGEEGMKAIVRPGPYVCAEWDLGGIPAWILAEKGVKLRSTDARYLAPAKEWLKRMAVMIEPLSISKGGPVIMVQLENEYANFAADQAYLQELQSALRGGGYSGMLFTCDMAMSEALEKGGMQGMVKAVNFGRDAGDAFRQLEKVAPDQPLFTAEFWVGWFDQWQRPHHRVNLQEKSEALAWMMERKASFNLYMFHGGTTRGMWTGANLEGSRYRPTTCGYDYDAPLDESGRPTEKYHAFRQIIAKHLKDETLPEVPASVPAGGIGAIEFKQRGDLFAALAPEAAESPLPSMEDAGLANGFILYRAAMSGPFETSLDLSLVKDRVSVLMDGSLLGTGGRSAEGQPIAIKAGEGAHRIDFLVENMGRANFGVMDGERKGLESLPEIAGAKPDYLGHRVIPADRPPEVDYRVIAESEAAPSGISLLKGGFRCDTPVDTWLDMRGFGRGVVWLNGRNLGRYWSAGPSNTIFVPAAWLSKDGENEVVLLELELPSPQLRIPTVGHQIWAGRADRPKPKRR
ncbi:beta-galactosidase [Luteolibacter sp. GHJ8]|uniref:Beta-galactosidase n=2 Tax=Luteolibacter rhizosphaerae TaxID=2989719 RepID=A0ABT3G5B2_9BACT|nr:beta-galactosidase [Luteolibacter rhizosphaerae]